MLVYVISIAFVSALVITTFIANTSNERIARYWDESGFVPVLISMALGLVLVAVFMHADQIRADAKELECHQRCRATRTLSCGEFERGIDDVETAVRYSVCADIDGGVTLRVQER